MKDVDSCQEEAGTVDIFTAGWLEAFGYCLSALYLVYFFILYRAGKWIVSSTGVPIYTDFGNAWAAGLQALRGDAAALYDPARLMESIISLFGPTSFFYPNWPYPPTYFAF